MKNNFETGVKTAIHAHPVTAVAFLRGRVRVSFVVTWFKSDTRRASSAFFLLRSCLKHDKGRSLVTRKFEGVLYTGILTKVQAKVQSSRRENEIPRDKAAKRRDGKLRLNLLRTMANNRGRMFTKN